MSGIAWSRELERRISENLDALGVEHRFDRTRRHARVVLRVNGREQFYSFPSSPSDYRGLQNTVCGVRRLARAMLA